MAVHVKGDGPRKWPLSQPQPRRRDSRVYVRRFTPGTTPPPLSHPTELYALDALHPSQLPLGFWRVPTRERRSSFNRTAEHAEPEPLALAPADLAEVI